MRNVLIGLLVAAVVVAGAAWFAMRSPGEAELQGAGRAPDPVATDSVATHPGSESESAAEVPVPHSSDSAPPETTREDRPELVTLDPQPPASGGPTLESIETAPDVTVRDELITVPVDADASQSDRPELETVPADPPESTRRDELAEVPVPGQGNTSTR